MKLFQKIKCRKLLQMDKKYTLSEYLDKESMPYLAIICLNFATYIALLVLSPSIQNREIG